ncbi:polymorphic toxin type 50 domain-containing protein [Allobaculum mucilyticum]|uniref:polymorphic toxin type 50 domain-containing protein n=1 Tax=Allobaculum mucilyticum TaxID=2834459 RepID=UPI001E3EDE36|nr:polymorphic toxin type 50 domain-containing protein [Allobaculum mucilyticum]UNT97137.1 hypothetical protein KWG62_05150 [Allobaculum mucilyticum]
MSDIVPGLKADINAAFDSLVASDPELKSIIDKISSGRPAYKNVYDFSRRLGEIQTEAINKALKKNGLPDDAMYYNIANRIIPDSLKRNFEMISELCTKTAERQNKSSHIGLAPHEAKFDKEKADGIVQAISGKSREEAQEILSETIMTNCQKVVDDFIRGEAEFHSRCGLHPQISRISNFRCCEWCLEKAGRYNYPHGTPPDVFKRHANCNCTIEYWPGDGRSQNVHDKSWKSAEENGVTAEDLEKATAKQERKIITGPEAAKIRERIIDFKVKRSTEDMERIVEIATDHPDSEVVEAMIEGQISPNMNYEHSGRHIRDRLGLKDADEFDETRSEILADAQTVEKELSKVIGTGKITGKSNKIREIVYCPDLTGVVVIDGIRVETHFFKIHHSNTGWHAVPVNFDIGDPR